MQCFETRLKEVEISSFADCKPSNSKHIFEILNIVTKYKAFGSELNMLQTTNKKLGRW